MIHYHGGPVTPTVAAYGLWHRRHACVSFAHPQQVSLAADVCQSFILDNGAYSAWTQGSAFDFDGYVAWVREWMSHPAFDWCLIPDVIDGDASENDGMIARWAQAGMPLIDGRAVPVWHLHESTERLRYLCHAYPRVALGSSGQWATVGTAGWWQRMEEIIPAICDEQGRPKCKLHGLRMLAPDVFRYLPLASADSTNVARNIGIDKAWKGTYAPMTAQMRALVMAERIELSPCAASWTPANAHQNHLEMVNA